MPRQHVVFLSFLERIPRHEDYCYALRPSVSECPQTEVMIKLELLHSSLPGSAYDSTIRHELKKASLPSLLDDLETT